MQKLKLEQTSPILPTTYAVGNYILAPPFYCAVTEDQLTKFIAQFQGHLQEQPALIDISTEEIIRWDPNTKEKAIVTPEEFENVAELNRNKEAKLAVAEIFQAGHLELCGIVYCLASRGLPIKYL